MDIKCKICNALCNYSALHQFSYCSVDDHYYSLNNYDRECISFCLNNNNYILLFDKGTIAAYKYISGSQMNYIKIKSSFKPINYNKECIIGLIDKMLLLK